MIEVLFKSEELLIAESKVIYGNTSKSSAVEYLIPQKVVRWILSCSLLRAAKQIKVTTKTEVVVKTAKSSMVKTAEDALRIADKFGLKAEVQRELDNGATPLEALREWDII